MQPLNIKGKVMDKQKILNKYTKPEDKLLISKLIDKMELATAKNKIEYTDFLDLYQKHLLEKILRQENIKNYIITGGIEEAERNIVLFYPEKLSDIINKEYSKAIPINCIRIKLPKEMYNKYTHRDYLGGLIKLGLKRKKIGDILVFEDGADILVLNEISKFLINNLNSLTRFSKSVIENVQLYEVRKKEVNKQEMKIIVPSMRMDCIVAEILNTSRGNAEEIISSGRVYVNFENIEKQTKQIQENDIITIRGKGRFEVGNIEGKTRNDRIKLIVNKFV